MISTDSTATFSWESFGMDIAKDLLSNLIFSLVAIIFAFFVAYYSYRSKRIRRFKVLNLDKVNDDVVLHVFIAHLVVQREEATLANGRTKSMHFSGSAVPIQEIKAAYLFKEAIDSSFIRLIPRSIRDWLVRNYKGYSRVFVDIKPAPIDFGKDINHDRIILIGGPEFNSLTNYFLEKARLFTIFNPADCNEPEIRISFNSKEKVLRPTHPNFNLGLVQRVTFTTSGKLQTILFLVGVGTNGTLSAVHWFLKNWDLIDKKYGKENFGIVFECEKRAINSEGFLLPTRLYSYPEGSPDLNK